MHDGETHEVVIPPHPGVLGITYYNKRDGGGISLRNLSSLLPLLSDVERERERERWNDKFISLSNVPISTV